MLTLVEKRLDLEFFLINLSLTLTSDYDNKSTDETGYKADNSMYAFHTSLEHISKNSEGSLIFHYHNDAKDTTM